MKEYLAYIFIPLFIGFGFGYLMGCDRKKNGIGVKEVTSPKPVIEPAPQKRS